MVLIESLLLLLLISANNSWSNARAYDKLPIKGGNDTQPGDFKYVVAITRNDEFLCGGGIIHEKYIITAAHCFYNESIFEYGSYKVIAGTNDMANLQDPQRVEGKVMMVHVPRTYDPVTGANDIAIIKLMQGLELAKNGLKTLRIPGKPQTYNYERFAVLAGFGAQKAGPDMNGTGLELFKDDKLHWANILVLSDSDCNNYNATFRNYHFLCAHMLNEDENETYGVCFGDSGSPLVYNSNLLIGIDSKGDNDYCEERQGLELYTDVSAHINFIKAVFKSVIDPDIKYYIV